MGRSLSLDPALNGIKSVGVCLYQLYGSATADDARLASARDLFVNRAQAKRAK